MGDRSINLSHHLVPFYFKIKNQNKHKQSVEDRSINLFHHLVPFYFKIKNQKSEIKININNRYRTEASICPTISSLFYFKIKSQKSKIKNQNQNKPKQSVK